VSNEDQHSKKANEGNLGRVLSLLDHEAEQENSAFTRDGSMLIGVDPDVIRRREEEYRDPEKQWIRRRVWLELAKSILKTKRESNAKAPGIRYLTLPAYHRLDVSLMLEEELIEVTRYRDGKPEEIDVAAFENEPTKFGLMKRQMPHFKFFGCANIEDVLTDSSNRYFKDLESLFPFDIVNLDLTTSLTPRHEGPYSKTMMAIEKILDLQCAATTDWALFLTFRNVPADLDD
jgi:hypothetical protein